MKGVDKLQKRLRAINDAYGKAPRPKTDSVKRIAKIKSLDAVIAYLKEQPGYHHSDAEQIYRLAEALADVERGRNASWLSSAEAGSPPVSIRIRRKQAEAGEHLDQLIHSGLGPKEAAKKVLKAIPSNSSLLEGTKGNEKTVARWRYKKR